MKKTIILVLAFTFCLSLQADTLEEIIDNYLRYNKWKEAKVKLELFINQNSNNPQAYTIYAGVLSRLGLNDEAIIATRKAINYESNSEKKGEYYANLGYYYYEKKLNDLAIDMFTKSSSYNSLLDVPYYMKGLIYYENNEIDKCLESWKMYINITSNFPKKEKISQIISRVEKKLLEEKLRAEEEARLKQELLDRLKDELSSSNSETSSMEEHAVIKDETVDEFFEEID